MGRGEAGLPAPNTIKSQNFKIPLVHELRKKIESNGKAINLLREGPYGENLKMLPSSEELYCKDLSVGK